MSATGTISRVFYCSQGSKNIRLQDCRSVFTPLGRPTLSIKRPSSFSFFETSDSFLLVVNLNSRGVALIG